MLRTLNFRNLDDEPAFTGHNTTTEFLARVVFDRDGRGHRARTSSARGPGSRELRVTLHESHVASAAFEGP